MVKKTVEINVTSNGSIQAETADAIKLKKELEAAASAANLASRTSAKIQQANEASMRSSAAALAESTKEYKALRGSSGSGSEARDFGKQASGLGGLVHVYATFAANIYAVSTAFNALSKAADTSNMTRGLEQLGAASGRNLTGLAKQLQAVSDGAISAKDALTATAAASAGGLSGQQLLRLTTVAKNASQALGRDMPDALNRLTRGVTKIEPELLDELGILVKVDMANQNYARSLGKTAASLTDLEKRQAFANEVITQGEKKFADINMQANPYAKLSASLSNLTQSGLEALNKVLIPIADVLSRNPVALGAAVAGLGAILLKQALPGIYQWRNALEVASKRAEDLAIKAAAVANEERQKTTLAVKTELDKELALREEAAAKYIALEKAKVQQALGLALPSGKKTKEAFSGDPSTYTEESFAKLQSEINRKKSLVEKYNKDISTAESASDIASIKSKQAAENKKIAILEESYARARALRQYDADHEIEMKQTSASFDKVIAERSEATAKQRQLNRAADLAREKQLVNKILSDVGERSKTEGFSTVFNAAKADIATAGLTGMAKATTTVKAGLTAAGAVATTFFTSLLGWLPLILVGFEALSYAVDFFSGNSKELDKFNDSLDKLNSNVSSAAKTLETLQNKKGLDNLSVEAIQARSNAFTELSDSTKALVKDLDKADNAATGFGRFIDGFKTLWSGDLRSKATKGIAESLEESLKVSEGKVKAQLTESLETILNTSDLTAKGITKALDGIDVDNVKKKFFELTAAQEAAQEAAKKQSNSLGNLKEQLQSTGKAANDLVASLAPNDSFSKYAVSTVQSANAITKAINESGNSYAAYQELVSDPGNLAAFSEDAAKKLLDQKKSVDLLAAAIKDLTLVEQDREAKKKQNAEIESRRRKGRVENGGLSQEDSDAMKANNDFLERTKTVGVQIADLKAKQEKNTADYLSNAVQDSLQKGADLLKASLEIAAQSMSIAISKAATAGLQGPGTADAMYKLRVRELDIQKLRIEQEAQIMIQQNAVKDKMEQLANELKQNTLEMRKASLSVKAKSGDAGAIAELRDINKEEDSLKKSKNAGEAAQSIINNIRQKSKSTAEYVKNLKDAAEAEKDPKTGRFSEAGIVLMNRYMQMAETGSKLLQVSAEKQAANITKNIEKAKELRDVELSAINAKAKQNENEATAVDLALQSSTLFSSTLIAKRNALAEDKAGLAIVAETVRYYKELDVLNEREKADPSLKADLEKTRAELNKQYLSTVESLKSTAANTAINNLKDTNNRILEAQARDIAYQDRLAEAKNAIAKSDVDTQQAQLSSAVQLGTVSVQYAALTTEQLALQTAELEKQKSLKQASNDYTLGLQRTKNGFAEQDAALASKGLTISPEDEAKRTEELTKQKALYDAQVDAINKKFAADTTAAKLTKSTTLEIDRQAKALKLLDNIGNSLTTVFGKVGSAVSNMSKTLYGAGKTLSDLTTQRTADLAKVAKDSKEANEIDQKYARETADVKLQAAADVAGSAADLFDQQSTAAKALHAVQKGFHVLKLAMDIEAMASDWAVTTNSVAADGVKTTSSIAAGAAKIFSQMGVWGFAGVAAMIALMATLGAKGGGKGATFTPSSEQLKETQGTGQAYGPDGKLHATGYGVLGDDSAKSESIKKSLEFIKQYTYEETEYSNKMLTALQNIDFGVNGLARGVARTSGTLNGTGFGTSEIKIPSSLESTFGKLIGGLFLGSIFGGARQTTITGSGINANGTVGSLASGATTANQYETGTTTVKGGWFRSDKTYGFTNTQAIKDDAFNKALQDTFKGISDTLLAAGTAIGLDSKKLSEEISSIPVNLSVETRGLKGSEISDAIAAVLSNTADMVATKVLAIVKPFQQLNEGLAETATRVARTSQVIDLQLASVGKSFGKVGLESLNARMALIELSGGLDQFVSDSNFFKDNFLSEAEKLAPIQKAVTEEMARLGLAGIDTRDKFKQLVLGLDLAKESDQQLYASLMKVERGFAAVYKEASDTADVLGKARFDLWNKALETLATKSQLLALNRQKELESIDAALRPMQMWIYALEDEATAREDLANAYEAENQARMSTIDGLKSSLDSLQSFSASLALGSNSPLSPEDKYARAKYEYEKIKDVLTQTNSSAEEKSKALQDLPNAINAFLETSKTYFASSDQFTRDYADTQATLALNIANTKAQLTIEQQSLDALKTQVGKLAEINNSVISVSTAINNLKLASAASTAAQANAGVITPTTGTGSTGSGSNTGSPTSNTPSIDYITAMVAGWYYKHPYIGRAPDPEGLAYWKRELELGKSIMDVKTAFTTSASIVANKMPIIPVGAFAKGGYMDGLALVGEQGPELVNFSNPGQVYTSGQTNNIFGDVISVLTDQIEKLTEEVKSLKEAANKNAITVSKATVESNMDAANIIAEAITESGSKDNWNKNRNTPVLM